MNLHIYRDLKKRNPDKNIQVEMKTTCVCVQENIDHQNKTKQTTGKNNIRQETKLPLIKRSVVPHHQRSRQYRSYKKIQTLNTNTKKAEQ